MTPLLKELSFDVMLDLEFIGLPMSPADLEAIICFFIGLSELFESSKEFS
jgi:hypothetical protein